MSQIASTQGFGMIASSPIERYQKSLSSVLNYIEEQPLVPAEIDAPIKYIIKHFSTIPKKCKHIHHDKTYDIQKINKNNFIIDCPQDQKESIIKIYDDIMTDIDGNHRQIHYE
jgi:hypothetical protein